MKRPQAKLLLYFNAIAFVFFGCDLSKIEDNNNPNVQSIVLCDLTRSIDSNAIYNISKHAAEIYLKSIQGTLLNYYGIGNSDYNEIIGRFKIDFPSRETREQQAIRDSVSRVISQHVGDTILILYRDLLYKKTCITSSLTTAFNSISINKNKYPNIVSNIFILSDLLEDCQNPILGKIDLVKSIKSNDALKENSDPTLIQTNLKSLGVKIYLISESKNDKANVSKAQLENSWRILLTHFGYSINDYDMVLFSWREVPDIF